MGFTSRGNMTFFTDLRGDINKVLSYGTQIRINHYTGSRSNTDYDDAPTLTQSGSSVYTSGLIMPIGQKYSSSNDALLLQQGKIKTSDKKIFIAGNIETSSTMKITIGSPIGSTSESYSIIPEGVICYPANSSDITYKTMYCRFLTNGSLSGE